MLLANRILWLAVGAIFLGITYTKFTFGYRPRRASGSRCW